MTLAPVRAADQSWMDEAENARLTEQTGPDSSVDGAAIRRLFPVLDWEALWNEEDDGEAWILEPLLSVGRMTSIYSAPKTGKSLLMLEVAVAVSKGTMALGATPDRARVVLYVDFENDPRGDVRSRLKAMDYGPADLANLAYLSYPPFAGMDTVRGSQELLAAVDEYKAEVVIIDTISRAVEGKENDNDTWLGFYRNTGQKLKAAGIAVMRLDHSGKDVAKGQRGGSAKSGDIDAVWRLSRNGAGKDSFKLACEDKRMLIENDELVITRRYGPLRHTVELTSIQADRLAQIADLIRVLDSIGVAPDAGREVARRALKTHGKPFKTDLLADAIRQRKMSDSSDPESQGQVPLELPDPGIPGSGQGQVPAVARSSRSDHLKPDPSESGSGLGSGRPRHPEGPDPVALSLETGSGPEPRPYDPYEGLPHTADLPEYEEEEP